MTRAGDVLTDEAVAGVHRITHAHTNSYLVDTDDGVILVDTGLPGAWRRIQDALRSRVFRTHEPSSIILTHGHFDHVGTARRAYELWGVPVLVHVDDVELAEHPYTYEHEKSRFGPPLRHPASWPLLGRMALAGAFTVRGVPHGAISAVSGGDELPGGARMIVTPGHTRGHIALSFPNRDVVISGDALVTLDPYTGRTGPQIVAGSATADSALATESLAKLAATGAGTVLPGHGQPWRHGIVTAVHEALASARDDHR